MQRGVRKGTYGHRSFRRPAEQRTYGELQDWLVSSVIAFDWLELCGSKIDRFDHVDVVELSTWSQWLKVTVVC